MMSQQTKVQESATFWHARDLGDLELLRASYVTHSYSPHTHEGFALGVIEWGAERFSYRHDTHVAPQGAVVLINPGEVHTGAAAIPEGWRYRMIYPEVGWLQRAASQLTGRERPIPYFADPVVFDSTLASALLKMHAALELSPDPLERELLLLGVLAAFVARHADTLHLSREVKPEPDLARRVRAYLEEHLAEPVSLAHLAADTRVSAYHLLRVFRMATGMPPHTYLTQMRVDRARRLLAQGLPPATVAPLVGFYDQSHLTRHFKRVVGVPPARYAQA
jgi:AraC-like DNA-binding protein